VPWPLVLRNWPVIYFLQIWVWSIKATSIVNRGAEVLICALFFEQIRKNFYKKQKSIVIPIVIRFIRDISVNKSVWLLHRTRLQINVKSNFYRATNRVTALPLCHFTVLPLCRVLCAGVMRLALYIRTEYRPIIDKLFTV